MDDDHVCAICCEPVLASHTHELRCGHVFHSGCLITWFSQGRPSCPTCRDDQAQYHERIPRLAVRARGQYLRKKYARRVHAPVEVKRRIESLRRSEEVVKQHRAALRQFRVEHRDILQRHERLLTKTYTSRWKATDALHLLGLYQDEHELLPPVVVDSE